MVYEKPISIQQAIASVADDEYVLPAIQREFVWDTDQIETLFDSLMRDYPISTFLFWKVKAENVTKFQFYRFLKNYHERDERHNHEATLSGHKDVIALLDGQQRLTSIYIGLKGSYASRLRYHRSSSDHAYPKKYLHLNLLRESEDITREYDFQFLTEEEAAVRDESQLWVPASKVLDFKEYEDASDWVNDTLEDFSADLDAPLDKEIKKAGRKRFCTLYRAICERETINFFLEQSEELDKVLQIFIRINQGGTPLSYSDLLLSIATAQWKTLDARQEIHSFVDRINDIGKGFNFNKDFVLKSCLVLADINDVKFKVDNFSSDNMALIEEQWSDIANAIELAIQLTAHFGFDGRTLTSTNAMVPIAYFIKKNGISENILHAEAHAENRRKIKLWLIRALLKKVFGGQPDSLYPVYRKLISESPEDFPLTAIISHYSSSNKSLDFYEDDISALMEVPYGSAFAFMLLSLVYALNHDYEFHQDHIHPKKHFTHKRLEKLGIGTHEEREAYIERFNSLPNLQLLQATPNQEKSGTMLEDWLAATQSAPGQLNQYKEIHCFPPEASLAFADFVDFYEARRELLMKKLSKILEAKVLQRVEDAPECQPSLAVMIEHIIYEFVEELRSGKLKVYNEISLQLELGIFIRSKLPEMKVQVERNVNVKYFFDTDEGFPKKKMDIAVWSEAEHGERDLSAAIELPAAIELRFPRNGRHPETMFDFIGDIAFCEKLKKDGFRSAYALIFTNDKLFYEGGRSDKKIYGYFRDNQELSGYVQNGKEDKTVCLSGKYWIDWKPIIGKLKFALVPV